MAAKITCLTLTVLGAITVVASAQPAQVPSPTNGAKAVPRESGQLDKINLNTATPDLLSKVLRLSRGSVTAIIESRKKSTFKDWNDFAGRRLVPSFAEKEIKARVTF